MGNAFLILHSLPCSLVTHKPASAKFERSYHIFHMFSSKKTGRKERSTPACPLSHIHQRVPCLCPCFELEVFLVIFQALAGETPMHSAQECHLCKPRQKTHCCKTDTATESCCTNDLFSRVVANTPSAPNIKYPSLVLLSVSCF